MDRKQGNRRFVPAGLTRLLIVESSPLLFGQALYLLNGYSACIFANTVLRLSQSIRLFHSI